MNHYFLWTDQCFLGLLMVGFILIIRGLRKEQNRRAFLSIFKKPIAMCASIILLFFLLTAILDSIHLACSDSVLDRILYPLGNQFEKTYSKPFALRLYSSETLLIKGHLEQIYPRLSYPPIELHQAQDVLHLVERLVLKALYISVLFMFSVVGGLYCLAKIIHKNSQRRSTFTWRIALGKTELAACFTFFICLLIVLSTYSLSRYIHVFGTGKIGQDILYYAVKSIRTGMVIGTLTTLFMMPLALFLGISAGYFGGVVDDVIQYIYTTLSSIPGVLLITASVLSMQTYIANHPQKFKTLAENADARLLALCFILGVTSWTSLCRLLRAEVLKLREVDFVLAARALGSSSYKIITKHLLPNVMHIVIITLVLDFSFLVLAEAVLSYVGVGVSPMTISWGNMINAARLELAREPIVWWPMLSAFALMFSMVLSSNLLADAVRDAFDPHHTG